MGSVNILGRRFQLERDSGNFQRRNNTLDFIRSLEPSTELAENVEKAMQETRKAKLREIV